MSKNFLFAAVGVLIAAFIFTGLYAIPIARVGAGYKAKILCSEVFVAGRNADVVAASEFNDINSLFDRIGANVDQKGKSVTASVFGLGRNRAIFRDGYGCTLVPSGSADSLPTPSLIAPQSWSEAEPASGAVIERIDYAEIDYVLDQAFTSDTGNLNAIAEVRNLHTPIRLQAGPAHRAFVVVVDGKIVAERYADGFTKDTPFLSWSMAKSVTATLVGAAALKDYLNVADPAPAPEWEGDDDRGAITWDDLLRMQSGLAFEEVYENPASDANKMLFASRDTGATAARKKLLYAPGERWSYSSGTSNLISRTLRRVLDARGVEFHAFAREAIFGPIGAASVILEPDASGTFVGSSFVYATARDWARLGQLYLQDGVWNGKQLLPEGWTDYVRTPTPASDGWYGAHFWLNHPGTERERWIADLPDDVFVMAGHEGQYVFIIPDKNAIIVRTGQTRGRPAMEVVGPVVADLYRAIAAPSSNGF